MNYSHPLTSRFRPTLPFAATPDGFAPLFYGLSPLDFRIILAPLELGPYRGVSFPTDVWPTQKRWSYRVAEVEAYRWPHTF